MYEIDSEKFTSKPDPKQEFRHYFKDSGAAAALQKAMMLLYRMPVKPTNLAEYLSQYFENGAQQIMKISLLKAELCYKKEELQNKRMKVQETESRIKQLIEKLGLTEEQFEQKYIPARIRDKNRLSIVERYFKELESGTRRMTENGTGDPNSENLEPTMSTLYDAEKECVKTSSSQYTLGEDMKELDPWGIICKGTKIDDSRRSKDSKHDPEGEDAASQDDDEGTSLAEQFQQSSQDWLHDNGESDRNKSNKILTVKKAANVKLTDFQGWSPLTSEEKLDISSFRFHSDPNTDDFRDNEETERIRHRTCAFKPTDMLKFQGNAKVDLGSHEPDNDSFLLDDDQLEEVLKIMETNQETFDFELPRYSREERKSITKDVCDPMCSNITDYDKICSASTGKIPYDDTAPAYGGEYYYDSTESLGFIPGKMINWTANMKAYPSSSSPGEYDEFNGEGAPIMKKAQCDLTRKAKAPSKVPLDVPMTRIDTSCHCIISGSYDTNEMLSDNDNRVIIMERKKVSTDGEAKGHKSSKKGARGSQQKDESTITEDAQLESELQEVFKQKQNRRSTLKKDKQKEVPSEDQIEDPSHTTELFGMDFAKEVKMALLGFAPSELNNAAIDISQVPHPSKTGALKSKTQYKDQ